MAGPERIMDEPKPGATGGVGSEGGGGNRPPGVTVPPEGGSPRGPEGPINPEDALAKLLAQALSNPAVIDKMAGLVAQSLAEQRAKAQQTAESLRTPEAVQPSQFQQLKSRIDNLEKQQPLSPEQQQGLEEARKNRDSLLQEANEIGLFDSCKESLISIYYGSRVKAGRKEREGTDDFEGRGILEKLTTLQSVVRHPGIVEQDRTGRTLQMVRDSKIFLGEKGSGFWSDSQRIALEARPEVIALKQQLKQQLEVDSLEKAFRGSVDYFNQEGLDMIAEIVKDRKRYTPDYKNSKDQSYPDNGLGTLWKGIEENDTIGNLLKDETGQKKKIENFDDIREAVEEARRQEPWIPNRGDYETYIQFVADDAEELEEMIPYIVAKVRRKIGTGEPQSVYQTLTREKEKIDLALAVFPRESESQFRRLKSALAANLNLMGAHFFSDKVRQDWQPYLHYMAFLASACQDTDYQDHLADSLLLDKDGLTLLALQQYSQDDGIFWRYNQKAADTHKKPCDMGDLFRWQEERRREISQFLMGRRLKKMDVLLGLNPDQNRTTAVHPAFQRLKEQFDALDEADKKANNNNILGVDGKPTTTETRWQEYCKKALGWQETGKFSDPRDAERVIFQHPLARAFKAPIKDAQGQTYDEFQDMFEPDTSVQEGSKEWNRWYASTKRRKIKSIMEKAERVARAFMLDSVAALAWHIVKPIDPKATGEELAKERERVKNELDEINGYLQAAGMDSINVGEAVPHTTLYRAMMQAVIREDKDKVPAKKALKFYYLLTEKLGLDLDLPTFASWYLGAHDTGRPAVILRAINQEAIARGKLEECIVMSEQGMDEKNTGAAWAERERRIGLLMEMVIKAKFGGKGRYFNFPGHDTIGAGVKDIRNILDPTYGVSGDTVWLSDLIKNAILGEHEFPRDHGCTRSPITQLVGLWKGSNEVIFKQSGYSGIIESPRDFEAWVQRFSAVTEQYKAFTSGDKEGFALLNDGPLSGGFLWRDFALADLGGKYVNQHSGRPFFAIDKPVEAIKDMQESTYRAGVELAAKTIAPLIRIMRNTVDSTFGKNPGSARFLNTLLWYAVSKWMDTSWEFRQKPGYAVDANLHLARYFIHQYLLEYGNGGLIYDDQEWDEIMLGYTIVEKDGKVIRVVRYEVDHQGNTVARKDIKVGDKAVIEKGKKITGEVHDGLINAFPKGLRGEILKGRDLEVRHPLTNQVVKVIPEGDYILPFGLNSKYPETLANYWVDSKKVQEDYEGALNQIKPREKVI